MIETFFLIYSDVRSKSFQAVDQFLQIVKQYNEKVFVTFLDFPFQFCFFLGIFLCTWAHGLKIHWNQCNKAVLELFFNFHEINLTVPNWWI